MNLNELARLVTMREGLKESISIAQVKEVLKIVLEELAYLDVVEMGALLKKYK